MSPDVEALFVQHLVSMDVHLDFVEASLEFCAKHAEEKSETTALGKARAFLIQAANQVKKAREELDNEFDQPDEEDPAAA